MLALPLLFLLLAGPAFLLFLLSIPVSALLIYEWQRLQEPFSLRRFLPLLFGVLIVLLARLPVTVNILLPENVLPTMNLSTVGMQTANLVQQWPQATWFPESILYNLLLLFFFVEGLLNYRPNKPVLADVSRRFFGVIYCAVPLALLLEIRVAENGRLLVCFLLLTIWATDAGAYFMGRSWGKRKLAPNISPGKTRAGFFGGVLFASITGGSMAYGFSLPFGWIEAIFIAGILSIAGQVGDLAESLLKREAGIKDSGKLIPGHGGMLDRLDSLLFASPVFYLFLWVYMSSTLKEW